jgi:hypothetical protein
MLLILSLGSAETVKSEPEPYAPTEFPNWALDLRRAEIVGTGVFPLTFFVSSFMLDLYRLVTNNFDPRYAVWPFKRPGAPELTRSEKNTVLITSISLSAVIAFIDFYMGKKEAKENTVKDE